MKKVIIWLLLTTSYIQASTQTPQNNKRLKVFIDCSYTWCDYAYIKSEINIIDYSTDRLDADLHILITSRGTGSGSQYQLIFFGQNQYKGTKDTLRFDILSTSTESERREALLKHLKIGLTPYIFKAGYGNLLTIDMKQDATHASYDSVLSPAKDPWNFWVFRIGFDGNVNEDAVYKSHRLSLNGSANRITDQWKILFNYYIGENKSVYEYETDQGKEKIKVKNSEYNFYHALIKSISNHWSIGYDASYSNSTFNNNKSRIKSTLGIEYNIFPYKLVNNKLLTFQYRVDVRRNVYYDTTLYDKTKEVLFQQSLVGNLTLNQKWGAVSTGIIYKNYLHNWRLNNFGVNLNVNVRITGGLSFYVYSFGGLVHDQVYLPKEGATEEEVLTRRRQLESSYNFFSGFGLNYRFGSKISNFVNPRFDSNID